MLKQDLVIQKRLQRDIDLLDWTVRNFGDFTNIGRYKVEDSKDVTSVIGYHMMKSEKYEGITFSMEEIIEELNEDQSNEKGRKFEVSGNEQSLREMASAEI
jgi:hypothetical protein